MQDPPSGQDEAIALLADPATHGGAAVECIETHISMVFLAGAHAFKLKRAVTFDYLDFSTPDLRRRCCEEEVRRNRRTAPSLYLGVLPITREPDGTLALGGDGTAVDWVVRMRRFDQAQLFDRLAESGSLDRLLMAPLGRAIASFHRAAAPRPGYGGAAGMQFVIDGNADGLVGCGALLERAAIDQCIAASRAELDRRRVLLDRRRASGHIRECHGDMHLRNVVLIDDHPTLFDAIEFNEAIACIDVLYDLAFLLMDLRHRGLRGHASTVWNAWLEETADYGGLELMPLFLSCRAAVRAKISAMSARVQHDRAQADALTNAARAYLADAIRLLEPHRPAAIAIGGPSGSGKSTAAAAIAPEIGGAPGAIVLRSDVIRKRLCGAGRLDRLDSSGYTPEVNARVYAELATRASAILAAGHSVIADAAFTREVDRDAIEAAARREGVTFQGFWLDAPDAVLRDRISRRTDDPSDADAAILAMQRAADSGRITWKPVDAENPTAAENIVTYCRET
jgi:aminoglycoside phosphotransferase family enzyme/predicted kinase